MPLTPETEAMLKEAAAAGMRPYQDLSVEEARAQIRKVSAQRGPGEPVAHVENRTIPGPAGEIPVRVYRPDGSPPSRRWSTFTGVASSSPIWIRTTPSAAA